MMSNIFYCPKCKHEEKELKYTRDKITWINCRDGYGRGITHIICPYCGYELAGTMKSKNDDESEISYVRYVIKMYSDRDFIDVDKIIENINKRRNQIT